MTAPDPSNPGKVIVTGGASGLGRAVAEAVESAGGTALVLDREPPSNGFDHRIVDLSDTAATTAAVTGLAAEHGGIDAVVTAAGTDKCGALSEIDAGDWEQVVRVNLFGTAAVVRAALPHLERVRGRIVTVASTLGFAAAADASAYCASKFGVVGLTRALSLELAGRVGVTMLVPGGMQTAFFDGREEQYKPPADAELNPPDAVAEAVLFALSTDPPCELRELVVTPSRETSWPP